MLTSQVHSPQEQVHQGALAQSPGPGPRGWLQPSLSQFLLQPKAQRDGPSNQEVLSIHGLREEVRTEQDRPEMVQMVHSGGKPRPPSAPEVLQKEEKHQSESVIDITHTLKG